MQPKAYISAHPGVCSISRYIYTVVKYSKVCCADNSGNDLGYIQPEVFIKYKKHYPKMWRNVGMAVPKTTETRCRDGSVQATHVIQILHN